MISERPDGWWFYDEGWVQRYGPFDDEAQARQHAALYGLWLDDGNTDYNPIGLALRWEWDDEE